MAITDQDDPYRKEAVDGPSFVHLFGILADLNAPLDAGDSPAGRRILDNCAGGTFEGERLRGTIAPGAGGDWRLLRKDGSSVVDARVMLRTDDGAIIHMSYGGRIVIPSEHLSRVRDPDQKHLVDPALYYFKVTPVFETGAEAYAWLNDVVCIGVGRLTRGRTVAYEVFQVI
jgi:hypothetical protein